MKPDSLFFGSVAAKYWHPEFREPNDTDLIQKEKPLFNTFVNGKRWEYHWVDALQYVLDNNKDDHYVDPDFLYTIKVSHAAWNINFEKHMKDIMFLKQKGCVLDKVLYEALYKEWEALHGKKKVKMNQMNDDFFTDAVKREFDHDWLHEFLAFGERPMHERIRKSLESPLPSKELWDKLTYQEQLQCASEEIFVVATERYLDGNPKKYKVAKGKSMKNLITSMTKGWFNLFLIENFGELYYNDEMNQHWLNKLELLKGIKK